MSTKIYAELLEQSALDQFNEAMSLDCNIQGALMPDAHQGYTLPIGAVIKSKGAIFPSYVGYDIGCGMSASRLNIKADQLTTPQLIQIKEKILATIPVGTNRHSFPQTISNLPSRSSVANTLLQEVGAYQLGTLGGGNHFIELGVDNDGYLNIIIHSGSRKLGHSIAQHYMQLAAEQSVDLSEVYKKFNTQHANLVQAYADGKVSKPTYDSIEANFIQKQFTKLPLEGHYSLDIDTVPGQRYIEDMNFALEFAKQNRQLMITKVTNAITSVVAPFELQESRFINRNHNHAELVDNHVIHRKGATHAEKDMLGVIPGNMKDGSFIVRGKGNPNSICSSSHGAGRVLSRRKAKELLDVDKFNLDMSNIITNHTKEMLDEAPQAYKNIFEVMDLQQDLVEIIDHIRPILNIKG